jgi:hypothetical protein
MQYITKTNLSSGPQFGSQMTQYAGLYSVHRKTGLEIVFIERFMSVFRGVKLFDAFDLPNKIVSGEGINFEFMELADVVVDSTAFTLDTTKSWDIYGWFHTFNYFHEFEQDLQSLFTFRPHIREEATRQIDNIKNSEPYPLVSLHVRRGDYVAVASLNLELSYYTKALNVLFEKFDYAYFKLLVFSDDIQWCKQNIQGENIVYVENNSNYVDMCMMSMCDHNIIANSSFSWWGAYLNQSTDKIVICPNEYVGPSDAHHQFINGNYFPNNWIPLTTKADRE